MEVVDAVFINTGGNFKILKESINTILLNLHVTTIFLSINKACYPGGILFHDNYFFECLSLSSFFVVIYLIYQMI
jgi:hypothetical protein